jgi:hypothetical protein
MIWALLLAAAVATPAPPGVRPNPIGLGPRYLPAADNPAVLAGKPIGALICGRGGRRFGVHVELFAHRRVIVVPAGIGVAAPQARRGGDVLPRGCSYGARTRTPTGIVEVREAATLTLADMFRIWGRPLTAHRLAGFRSETSIVAFVAGRRWRGDVRRIPLRRHAQIVVELDGYVVPHPDFVFPGGL